MGFRTLHVVDLDAALGEGDNRGTVLRIVESTDATVQVGGGIRDEGAVGDLLAAGTDRVVVGTRAVDDPHWLSSLTRRFPNRILVAADIRNGLVLRRGWQESTGIPVREMLLRLDALPLAGILCTDVGREGRMGGVDLDAAESVIRGTRHPVWISGGITTLEEMRSLQTAGAEGAVLGMAIYTGVLSPESVAKEFGS